MVDEWIPIWRFILAIWILSGGVLLGGLGTRRRSFVGGCTLIFTGVALLFFGS